MVKRKILYDIKIATGIAILLVVIGHLASRGQDNLYVYVNLKNIIYKFHMPLFLFLSGYISGYTYRRIDTFNKYVEFIKRKSLRLIPAYLLLSIIFFSGKYFLGQQQDFFQGVLSIFLYPSKGNSGFLWYLYVLFLYYLILPLIMLSVSRKFYLFFIGSVLVSFINFTDILSLNFFFWYLPFYILGCFLSKNIEQYMFYLKRFGIYVLVMFFSWIVLEYFYVVNFPKIVAGIGGIIAVHYISLIICERNKFFEILGDNSFNIYLFNSMFIGGLTYFIKIFLDDDQFIDFFYLIAPFLIFSGIYFPLILYKIIKKRAPLLAKYIH